jgi:hypothetical protein
MSKESNLRKCKKCQVLKIRILDGKYDNGRDKRWLDDEGKIWNGSLCPLCNVERARTTMKRLRA